MSKITFHKKFEEEKAKFSVNVYDLIVLDRFQRDKYGLYNFYTRESILICFNNNEFIQARRKEILDTMEYFMYENDNANDHIQQLNRFYSCFFLLNPKNNISFENIDELWVGLSKIFEAFFFSRSHQFRKEKEIILHMTHD